MRENTEENELMSLEKISEFVNKSKAYGYVETSAKTGYGVKELFEQIVPEALRAQHTTTYEVIECSQIAQKDKKII